MKLTKYVAGFLAIAATLIALPAAAQFDAYSATRTVVLTVPQNLTVLAANGLTTNTVDCAPLFGVAKIDILCNTNVGNSSGTLTATLYGSADSTNYVALANYAIQQTPYALNITNAYWSTNCVTTDTLMLPGTVTTPTAATAGFPTTYLVPTLYTNTAAITLVSSGTTTHNTIVGVKLFDQLRYLHIVYLATGGTVTNFNVSATITAPAR